MCMLYDFKQHINTFEALHNIDIPFKNQFILSIYCFVSTAH